MKKIFVLLDLNGSYLATELKAAFPNEVLAEEAEMLRDGYIIEEIPFFENIRDFTIWWKNDKKI